MHRDSKQAIRDCVIYKRSDIENSGWRKLADAIVLQTANDYRGLLRRLVKHPYNLEMQHDKSSIERFFRSDWFCILCDLDGREFAQKLKITPRRMEGVQ